MVKIFFCGPGGSGKTSLANGLRKEKKFKTFFSIPEVARTIVKKRGITRQSIDKFDTKEFLQLQGDILLAQNRAEEKASGHDNLLCDRTVLDCLAYALWKTEEEFQYVKLEEMLKKHKALVDKSVARYQKSLIVLVHPWSQQETADDGVRLSMSHEQCARFAEILTELLNRFKIGYLNLADFDFKSRLTVLERAAEGQVQRNSYNLQHYMEISAKRSKNARKAGSPASNKATNDTYLSFYLGSPDDRKFIRSMKFCEDKAILGFTELESKKGRLFHYIDVDDFFCLEFDGKVRATDVQRMLLGNIFVSGEQFSFFGCSMSGLRTRKAFLLKGDAGNVKRTLAKYGEFEKISSVSKRMARIALLFSSVHLTDIKVDSRMITNAEDIYSTDRKYNFSDGCGGISMGLAKAVMLQMPENEKIKAPFNYVPSVYQIRLQGYKGVVALDERMEGRQLLVRPSMKKFETLALPNIALCGFSRPYTYGNLNRQYIHLLSALGVQDEVFLALQREQLRLISEMLSDVNAAITMLHWMKKPQVADMIMTLANDETCSDGRRGLLLRKSIRNALLGIRRDYIAKGERLKNDGKVKEKLRIIVKKSRLLYGICDQGSQLRQGQCYLRVTVNDVPKTITGKIVTGRMPSYLLGDIRVLQAVDVPGLCHLVDCIVFPTVGRRPHADEQSGGDLDGDKFFVTWDSRLIPPKTMPSHEYPAAESRHEGAVTQAKMIRYFSVQNQATKIAWLLPSLFERWADTRGPQSRECEHIGQLYGRAIDATKTGEVLRISESLLTPPTVDGNREMFVWQKMDAEAKLSKSNLINSDLQLKDELYPDDISMDFVKQVLEDEEIEMSEYQKFNFLWRVALSKFQDEVEAAEFINGNFRTQVNFALFTSTEKMHAIDAGVSPSFVANALTKSTILSSEDVEHINVPIAIVPWGMVYQSEHSAFSLNSLSKKLPYYDEVLICLQLPDEVTISLKIMKRLLPGTRQLFEKGTFTATFISKRFGYRKSFSPGSEFYYDLEDGRLQIYRNGKLAQTFLWLKCSNVQLGNEQGAKAINFRAETEVQDCISVDLSSFGGNILRPSATSKPHPLVRKAPLASVEVFASVNGHPAYPDLLVGNEIETVEEQQKECSSEEPDNRVVSRLLLEKIDAIRAQQVVTPKDGEELLDQIVAYCIPWNGNCTTATQPALDSFIEEILPPTTPWKRRLHIAICVCRLGHFYLAEKILLQEPFDEIPDLSNEEFLQIMEHWIAVWYIPPGILVEWVKVLRLLQLSKPHVSQQETYLINVAWNAFIELANDVTLCKERLSMSFIDNLRASCTNQGKNLSISMYRTSHLQSLANLPASGDYVILLRGKDWKKASNFSATTSIARVISSVPAPFSVTLELLDDVMPAVFKNDAEPTPSSWTVCPLAHANITLFSRIIGACSSLLSSSVNGTLFGLILADSSQPCVSHIPAACKSTEKVKGAEAMELDPAQVSSVNDALRSPLTLIHGPPGTGKTKVACAILQGMAERRKGSQSNGILALAETNTAVDNMTRILTKLGLNVVRVGNMKHVPGDLYDVTLQGKLRLRAELEGKRTDFRDEKGRVVHRKSYVRSILDQAEVVLTTCAGVGDSALSDRKFTFVLVDEATQTKEGTILCGLAKGAEQLVMIGDPNQLGPVVKLEQNWKWLSDDDHQKVSDDLQSTLFHRLSDKKFVVTHFLDTQYRMHPSMAEFASEYFYGGQLHSGTTAENRQPSWKLTKAPTAFLHVEGNEKKVGASYQNEEEVRTMKKIVTELLRGACGDIAEANIAILALYNGQVRKLRDTLPRIEVNSIDGFQGREAEIVLVSTVRSKGDLGFSDDKRRLTVLLTRAKRGLLIVGHRNTLMKADIWNQWLKTAHHLKEADIFPKES